MANVPIVITKPKVVFQQLDADLITPTAGEDPVDMSGDFASVELGISQPITNVKTFLGTYNTPGDVEESINVEVVVSNETSARWLPFINQYVAMTVWDRELSASGRTMVVQVGFDPSLYGPTTPGSARSVSFDIPVLDGPAWVAGTFAAAIA